MGLCELCRTPLDAGKRGPQPTTTVAHIKALEDGGPRADPALSIADRNAIGNLLLVCPGCHDLIDKDVDTYTVEYLNRAKADHEAQIAAVRQISQAWNMRFGSVDYANLPRLAMLPGGEAVARVAEAVGLDDRAPFDRQGLAPGRFVQGLRSVLETWSQHAVPLEAGTVGHMPQGTLVTFEMPLRFTRPSRRDGHHAAPTLLTGRLGEHSVALRFDPRWLTTATARHNVDGAADHPRIFAGMGRVVAVGAREIQISAVVFGQPQETQAALSEYLMHSRGGRRSVAVDLFEQPGRAPGDWDTAAREPGITVALHFDSDYAEPVHILLDVLRQLQRVVPEYRRDLPVALGVLTVGTDDPDRSDADERAIDLLDAGDPAMWRTFTVTSLASLLELVPVAVIVVSGLTAAQVPALHEALAQTSESYRGSVQVIKAHGAHRDAYGLPPAYRLKERDLHLLINPADAANGLTDDYLMDFIAGSGLFTSVDWRVEDTAPHRNPVRPGAAARPAEDDAQDTTAARSSQPSAVAQQRDEWFARICREVVDPARNRRQQVLDGVRDDLGDPLLIKALTFLAAVNLDGRGHPPSDIAQVLAASGVFAAHPDLGALSETVLAAREWACRFRYMDLAAAWDPEQLHFMLLEYWAAQRRTTHPTRKVRLELSAHWAVDDPRTLGYLLELPAGPVDDYQPFLEWTRENVSDTRLASCLAACHTLPPVHRAWERWIDTTPTGLVTVRHLWELGSDLARLPAVETVLAQLLEHPDVPATEDQRAMFADARTIVADRRVLLEQAVKGLTAAECSLGWLRDPDSSFQDDCLDNYLAHGLIFHSRGVFDGVHPMRGAWGPHPWWSTGVASDEVPAALAMINDESPTIMLINEAGDGGTATLTLSVSGSAGGTSGKGVEFGYDLRSPHDACELLLLARRGKLSIDFLTEDQDFKASLLGTTCLRLSTPMAKTIERLATEALRELWPGWARDPASGDDHYALQEILRSESGELTRTSPRFPPS